MNMPDKIFNPEKMLEFQKRLKNQTIQMTIRNWILMKKNSTRKRN